MAAAVVAVAAVVTTILITSSEARPAQQLQVGIIGNLGGTVTVDGSQVIQLTASNGADQVTVTASDSVRIIVTSSGAAPRCSVHTAAGAVLADRAGPAPQVGPQTMVTGGGPADVVNAPSMESVTCEVDLTK
ncbi:hypothetical protein [Amycolatopsis lurida]|uniref:hypothetical protein n=1 Tax=Amycolatopsis lurida TaxID=31959 RepID=UPI0036643765